MCWLLATGRKPSTRPTASLKDLAHAATHLRTGSGNFTHAARLGVTMMSMPSTAKLLFEETCLAPCVAEVCICGTWESARTAVQPLQNFWPTKPCRCSARDGMGCGHRRGYWRVWPLERQSFVTTGPLQTTGLLQPIRAIPPAHNPSAKKKAMQF